MEIMHDNDIYLPLTIKIARFMYRFGNNTWEGSLRDFASMFMRGSLNTQQDLKSQIAHAISVLKDQGILTAKSGFLNQHENRILLQLIE